MALLRLIKWIVMMWMIVNLPVSFTDSYSKLRMPLINQALNVTHKLFLSFLKKFHFVCFVCPIWQHLAAVFLTFNKIFSPVSPFFLHLTYQISKLQSVATNVSSIWKKKNLSYVFVSMIYVLICMQSKEIRSSHKWSLFHLWLDHPGLMLVENVNKIRFLGLNDFE